MTEIIGRVGWRTFVPTKNAFTMTIDTTKAGSASNTFILPARSIGTYNATIDWGDGTTSTITAYNDVDLTHVYSVGGIYSVKITGSFPHIYFNNGGDKLKIKDIVNWGNVGFLSGFRMFQGCSNMTISATDILDMSLATNCNSLFSNCSSIDTALTIDLTLCTDGSSMFSACSSLNSIITLLNTQNLVTFANAFTSCTSFNQNLTLDCTSLLNFSGVFNSCSLFNSIITLINESSITNMSILFRNCTSLTDASFVNSWDTSSVTNMSFMFKGTTSLDNLTLTFDTSNVTNMTYMFDLNGVVDYDLSSFDMSSCTNINDMFRNTTITQSNYDSLLIGWTGWIGGTSTKTLQNGLNLNVGSTKYTLGGDAESARNYLTGTKLWTITDGGGI